MGRANRQGHEGASVRTAVPSIPQESVIAGWGEVVDGSYDTEEIQTSILYVDSETGKLMETDVTVAIEYSDSGDRGVSDLRSELRSDLGHRLLDAAEESLRGGEGIDRASASLPGEVEGSATLFVKDDHQTREVPNAHHLLSQRTTARSAEAGRSLGRDPYVAPQLREMEARWSGTDPITGEEIEPGEKIYYDKANKKAYKRDNPFVSVGAEGRYLWHMWKDNTDIDPVGLASTWKMLRERGDTPGDILRNQDNLMNELGKWKEVQLSFLSAKERAEESGEIPSLQRLPSVEMLQHVFPTEELRAELEGVIASGKIGLDDFRGEKIDNGGWSEELHDCLRMLSYRMHIEWHPNDHFWQGGITCYPGPWGKTTSGEATFPAYRRLEKMLS